MDKFLLNLFKIKDQPLTLGWQDQDLRKTAGILFGSKGKTIKQVNLPLGARMKTWLFASIFFTVGIVSPVSAMLDGDQEVKLDELKKLSESIPCLRPVVALLPEFIAYQNLIIKKERQSGAYIIDHAHRQIYMPQHIIQQIPFLAAKQSFERMQQNTNEKLPVTIKLDHPNIEAALLSWLSEIIEQDWHKVGKKMQLQSLIKRKLPDLLPKNRTELIS